MMLFKWQIKVNLVTANMASLLINCVLAPTSHNSYAQTRLSFHETNII